MVTTVVKFPEITTQQGSKEITHNEALRMLDAFMGNDLKTHTLSTPPAAPDEGDLHFVPIGATGVWSTDVGSLAHYYNAQWYYYVPWPGASLYSVEDNDFIRYDGANWTTFRNGGKLYIDVIGNTVLTSADTGVSMFQLGGTPAADFDITLPAVEKIWLVDNSSGRVATFQTGAGGTVIIQDGTQVWIYGDGTGIRQGITGLPGGIRFGGTVGLPIYTTAALPPIADTYLHMISVTDGDAGSPCIAVSDGGTWRRIALGAAVSVT